jgi:uncharacterized protein (TIGR03000 family)
MYSVVVMMALTGGVDVPDGHRGGGGCGCYGGGGHHRHHGRHGGGCGSGCGSGCGYGGGGCGMGMACGYGGGCGFGGYGGGMGYPMMGMPHGMPMYGPGTPATTPEGIRRMPAPEKGRTEAGPAPAVIVVHLPDDASLTVDGEATTSTSGLRVLVSPELNPEKDYHYTLQAEVVRDGRPVRVEERVAVRAGEETHVTLSLPTGVALR